MGGPDHVSPASGEISSFREANLCPVSSPHPPEYSLFQPPAPAVGVLRNQQMSNSGMDVPSSPRQPPAQPTPRPPPGRGSPRCPRSPHRASSWMRVSTVLHLPPQGALLDKGVHGAPLPPHLPAVTYPLATGQCCTQDPALWSLKAVQVPPDICAPCVLVCALVTCVHGHPCRCQDSEALWP